MKLLNNKNLVFSIILIFIGGCKVKSKLNINTTTCEEYESFKGVSIAIDYNIKNIDEKLLMLLKKENIIVSDDIQKVWFCDYCRKNEMPNALLLSNGTFKNSQNKYLFIEIGQKFKTNTLIIYSKEKNFYNCDFILFDRKNNNPDSVFSYIPIKCD
jgi:hypothetical protein